MSNTSLPLPANISSLTSYKSARSILKREGWIVFVDRDGTLIRGPRLLEENPPVYDEIVRIEQLEILPGVFEGLRELVDAGYELVMVTNQEGLGSEKFPLQGFEAVQRELLRRLQEKDIRFSNVFLCPHFPADDCSCRKPRTGLVDVFLRGNSVNRSTSLMIGDRDTDEEFARRIGVTFLRALSNERFPLREVRAFLESSFNPT